MPQKTIPPGIKYILLSTIFFQFMNVGVKMLPHIPVIEIVFFRALVTLIVGYILISRAGISHWGNNRKFLIARGVAGTGALILYFFTLKFMPLASAVTIQYMSPIFTIIIAGIMLKEPPSKIQWLFFLVSFAGVIMLKGFDGRVTPFELAIGISSALCSGLAYNFIRKLKDTDHALVVVFYFPLVTVPIAGVYSTFNWVMPHGTDWLLLLMIGLGTTIAQIFMTKAYQLERASNISNFNYLGSVYAIIIGYFMFGETLPPLAFAGIAVIVFGVVMSTRFRESNR